MDINNKRSRIDLKSYFVTNAIPTQSNFEELIDGMLNQKEDCIARVTGNPLSIASPSDDTGLRKVLSLYESVADPNPSWTLSLRPRTAQNPPQARQGLAIDDSGGNTRLFIDSVTGNVGVGTIQPAARLHVAGDLLVNGNVQITGKMQERAWSDITLMGNFVWGGAPFAKPGYYKHSNGIVYVRGMLSMQDKFLTNPASAANLGKNTMFTFPPECRPEYTCRFALQGAGGGEFHCQVEPDGTFHMSFINDGALANKTNAFYHWSLDYVSFRAYP